MQTDEEIYEELEESSWEVIDTVEEYADCDKCRSLREDVEDRGLDFVEDNFDPALRRTVYLPDTDEAHDEYGGAKNEDGTFYGAYAVHCPKGCTVEEVYVGSISVCGPSYIADQT